MFITASLIMKLLNSWYCKKVSGTTKIYVCYKRKKNWKYFVILYNIKDSFTINVFSPAVVLTDITFKLIKQYENLKIN